MKMCVFQQICRRISETVKDKAKVNALMLLITNRK